MSLEVSFLGGGWRVKPLGRGGGCGGGSAWACDSDVGGTGGNGDAPTEAGSDPGAGAGGVAAALGDLGETIGAGAGEDWTGAPRRRSASKAFCRSIVCAARASMLARETPLLNRRVPAFPSAKSAPTIIDRRDIMKSSSIIVVPALLVRGCCANISGPPRWS